MKIMENRRLLFLAYRDTLLTSSQYAILYHSNFINDLDRLRSS